MSKSRLFLLSILIVGSLGSLKAQKFIPSEVSIHSFSGRYKVSGVEMNDLLSVTPDFNWISDIDLPRDQYNFRRFEYETGNSLQLGFRLNSSEKNKATLLNLGLGYTNGFSVSAYYNFEDITPVDTIYRQGSALVLDSISDVSSSMAYVSSAIYNIRMGIDRDLIKYKRLSFRAGISFQASIFRSTTSNFYAMQANAYQIRYGGFGLSSMGVDGLYSGTKDEADPFAFSVMLPFSINYQLSENRHFLKNTSLVLGGNVGQRYYFHPELSSFKAKFVRYSIGLRYSIH